MKKIYKKFQHQQYKKKPIEAKTFNFSNNRKEKIISIIIVFCIPLLLYLQTITFKLTNFDDDLIIKNHITFLNDFHNAPKAFLTDAFTDGTSPFYRPIQTLSYMVDLYLSGGNNAWMYHLTNIFLLGLISCLLFLLLRKFLIPLKPAVLSTLIYCAHPLFVSNIAWIPARGDLQLMLFSLLSFLFFIEFFQKKKKIYLFWHWIFFTIALFCKETAAFLPLLYILYYFSFSSEKRFEKKYLINLILYASSGIFYYWLHAKAIGSFSSRNEILGVLGNNDEVRLISVLQNLHTIPESLTAFFIPFGIKMIPGFSLFKTITGLGIIILISILFFKNKERSKKEKIFCLSWFLILMLPTMLYKHKILDYLNHRFFLPLIGIMLFVLFLFPEKWFKKDNIKNSWLSIGIFIILFLSYTTFVKSGYYYDPITFYNSAISQNSNSALVYYNRGLIYSNQGIYNKAIDDFSKAVELKPNYADAYNNRGNTYGIMQLLDKAITDFTKTIEIRPDYAQAYYNRGLTYSNQKLYDKAINDYSKAIDLKPDYVESYNNRGIAYFYKRLFEKSCQDFKKAEELGSKEAKSNIIKFCK